MDLIEELLRVINTAKKNKPKLDYSLYEYSMEYDSYYEPDTGKWVEDKCSDPECEFCANRPAKAIV